MEDMATHTEEISKMPSHGEEDDDDRDKKAPDAPKAKIGSKRESKLESRQLVNQSYHQCSHLPNKETEFRVCVRIHEARNLVGTDRNPVLRVACRCGQQVKKTKSVKGSISPKFNDIKDFSFKCLPMAMMDKVLELKVLNVKPFHYDSLLGSSKMDLGVVYSQPHHSYHSKWLLLSDMKNEDGHGRGYLRVTVKVFDPGDNAGFVDFHSLQSVVDGVGESIEEEEDIDTICPTGVSVARGKLTIRIFRGEDFPQLDPSMPKVKKGNTEVDHVDPYCIVSFAGHKHSTPVISNDYDPKWNVELSFPFTFPTMSERIKFEVKDRDKGSNDDYVGTTFLNISQISAPGNFGFLPTFGPCFVNIYGSLREYKKLFDELNHLNKGLGEGVAYRGRILIEVTCDMDCCIDSPTLKEDIADPERVIQMKDFVLVGVFFSATKIHPHDQPVEFEMSIGTNGYSMKNKTLCSATPPLMPSHECSECYYMPWNEQKPCIEVKSTLEDCSYRIETLNSLIDLIEELEKILMSVKQHMDAESYIEAAQKMEEILKHLNRRLRQYSSQSPHHFNLNNLDKLKRKFHDGEFSDMRDNINSAMERIHTILHERDECSKENLSNVLYVVKELEARLKNLAFEPQNSIPDVFIWMKCGKKRIAVKRIPSHTIMYANANTFQGGSKICGKNCGKVQSITLTSPTSHEKLMQKTRDGAEVRVMLWLGEKKYYKEFLQCIKGCGGEFTTFINIYEYQSKDFKPLKWVDMNGRILGGDPKYDPRETLTLPANWKWHPETDSWRQTPPISQSCDKSGIFQDTIYEYECLSSDYNMPKQFFGNQYGEVWKGIPEEADRNKYLETNVECSQGWEWSGNWEISLISVHGKKISDKEGWMFASDVNPKTWEMKKKNYRFRRRTWTRKRRRLSLAQAGIEQSRSPIHKSALKRSSSPEEYWEYGYKEEHDSHFQTHKHSYDKFRRRQWTRMLVYDDSNTGYEADTRGEKKPDLPLQKFLIFGESHEFQLWAYVYMARDLYSGDRSGLSDPYAKVAFNNSIEQTKHIKENLCPKWNQTLMIKSVHLYGNKRFISEHIPPITVELWDKDKIGKDEYLGQTHTVPAMCWNKEDRNIKPTLEWLRIELRGKYAGEILAGFEIFLDDDGSVVPQTPIMKEKWYTLPPNIQPELRQYRVKFLCWGVRNLKRLHGLRVNPLVEVECGGRRERIPPPKATKDRKNINFPNCGVVTFDVSIPKKPEYAPPLNIKVFDKRSFREVLVGCNVTKSVRSCITKESTNIVILNSSSSIKKIGSKEDSKSEYDWWSKYYFSIGIGDKVQRGYADRETRLTVYERELESYFDNFTDFLQSFPLYRGKGSRSDPEDQVGCIKGAIKIYEVQPEGEPDFADGVFPDSDLPSNKPEEVIVRVYVVKGMNLASKDIGGSSDPYLIVSLGNVQKKTRDKPIYNNLDPLFGNVFQLPATLPYDHILSVKVMDWDRITKDDLIGMTNIDIENRFYSKYRATCGLPEAALMYGANKWRDSTVPTEILSDWVKVHGLAQPKWTENYTKVQIGDDFYNLYDFEGERNSPEALTDDCQQRLALHILRNKNLVPEHVETRNLYNPMHPNIEQGQLHMWVDIFRKNGYIPPPVDITLRNPLEYELRVVVWNTANVLLDEISLATGEEMSDIYVKGWLQDESKAQKTDVHYRSMDGTGNFNWRFVFPFEYIPAENLIISRKKEHIWSLNRTEGREKPIFTIEIWDNDIFTKDDYIGTIKFDLSNMPRSRRQEKLFVDKPEERHNLMKMEHNNIRGWWTSCYKKGGSPSEIIQSGDIELEFEVLTKEEAEKRPVGMGRNEPNMHPYLEKPKRPETSFLWLTSPLKSLRFIIWKHHWGKILGVVAVLAAIIIIIVVLVTVPQAVLKSIVTQVLPEH